MEENRDSIETHPHKPFVPPGANILLVGSFPGKGHDQPGENDWFYSSKRNQFWKIFAAVYNLPLETKKAKQELFAQHGIAIADVFLKIRRTGSNNSDSNLEVIQYNDEALKKILTETDFGTIFFTSAFVQKIFLKLFPGTKNGIILPSPSPRYARMSLQQKIDVYKKLLPARHN